MEAGLPCLFAPPLRALGLVASLAELLLCGL